MTINPHIFRSYDIRGTVPNQVNEEAATAIGKGYATYLSRQMNKPVLRLLVGRDNRTHGESIRRAFVEGITALGHQVDLLEDSPSPLLYFGVCHGGYDGGVNVTASHNPANYNGFKLLGKDAHSIAGDEIQAILELIQKEDFEPLADTAGNSQMIDVFTDYKQAMTNKVLLERPLKVVVDAGNGIAGKYYPEILRSLNCEVVELYCEQDGSFPNHEPDPVVEANCEDLKKAVREHQADIGVAFDGDGDRVGVVDDQGAYHDANETFVLLIEDIVPRHVNKPVIYTVSNSLIVPEAAEKLGGSSVMVPVGHSHVELALHEHGAVLGGEQSGHFFVGEDYYGFDDACYTTLKLLSFFARSEKKVSEHFQALPKVLSVPEMRPDCPDDKKFEVVELVSQELQQSYPCNTLDGVRAEFPGGGWLGIRASNTSPCLSVCIEASSQEELDTIYQLAKSLLSSHGLELT